VLPTDTPSLGTNTDGTKRENGIMTLLDLHPGRLEDAATTCTVSSAPVLDLADEWVGSSYPRCADGNGTLTHQYDIARAKAICSKCGLAEGCLSGALDRAEPYGVWGGHLLVEGVIVAVKRGRGRPPKNPRVIVVDEVPLPPHLVA
jgi:WhiB family transcriptional regulator, redox-sensing transcriptional regulator